MRKLFFAMVAVMVTQSAAFAVERDVMERAKLAFSEQLQVTSAMSCDFEWIAADAVYQYPLGDINVKLRVEGRDAVAAHLRAASEIALDSKVENISYFPTLDSNIVFVQYDLVFVDVSGERRRMVAIIEMRDDQIARFTQLNGAPEALQVLNKATGYFN